jgi:hypothetical protein
VPQAGLFDCCIDLGDERIEDVLKRDGAERWEHGGEARVQDAIVGSGELPRCGSVY